MSDKVAEAKACYEKAEKYLKTGLMKWRPDYDLAAGEYQRAAICFKAARMPEKFLEAKLKEAECHYQNHSFYYAAKAYEECAKTSRELDRWEDSVNYIEKACRYYREHGVPDTAALVYDKGAKAIENRYPEKAADFYTKACDTTMIEDRPRQAAEYAHKAARVLVKAGKWDAALEALQKEIGFFIDNDDARSAGRVVCCLVLVHLAKDDYVAAKKQFEEGRGCIEDDEVYTLNMLLEGWDEMDPEKICQALRSPFIMNMDTEYTKVATLLRSRFEGQSKKTGGGQADAADESQDDFEAGAML